jgi:S1-C subfamily serine protease
MRNLEPEYRQALIKSTVTRRMKIKAVAVILCGLLFNLIACRPDLVGTKNTISDAQIQRSLVRVKVTSQGYQFHTPWQQRQPTTQIGIGTVVPGNLVLVTAILVADHRYIELETLDTQIKHPAEVAYVDYEANLALLRPANPAFLSSYRPLQLADQVHPGDQLTIWQVKPDGDTVPAQGKITAIELTPFTLGNYFLAYRLDSVLQYQFGHLTLPALSNGRLAGLVIGHLDEARNVDVIATSVVRHFLEDAQTPPYEGFPMAGFHFGTATDPQLRRYIGLPESLSGIYIQKILKGGPADKAGLMEGDVIIKIGPFNITNTGQYIHPQFGKTSVIHLIRTGFHVGDRLPVEVFRKGQLFTRQIILDHRSPDEYLVPPYVLDRQPAHLIVGGLIIQELTLSYLREYGKEWAARAPVHLLYYNQNQDYLNGDQREKIVIISNIIPTPYTIGYENLSNLVVLRVNGHKINKLADITQAMANPVNGYHKFEVEQDPKVIFLDPRELPEINRMIEERYRIPTSPLPEAPK